MTTDMPITPSGDDELEPGESLTVTLDGFEGPLDLLLALARTRKVDLSALSMSALADQYLGFIAEARAVRLELAGDYLVMGAWLAFLKSRLLLPKEEGPDDLPSGEELAARLAFRLMRLEAMRNAAAQLLTRKQLGRDVFPRGMSEPLRIVRERQYVAEIYDLLKAYAEQRKRTVKVRHVVKARTVWSIKEARRQLERLVGTSAGNWVQLDMFLAEYLTSPELERTARASSFGASLELARDGRIELRQDQHFAPIFMRRREEGAQWERIG